MCFYIRDSRSVDEHSRPDGSIPEEEPEGSDQPVPRQPSDQ